MLALHLFIVRWQIFVFSFYTTEMLLFSGFQYKVLCRIITLQDINVTEHCHIKCSICGTKLYLGPITVIRVGAEFN